jgi:hypothetical protein
MYRGKAQELLSRAQVETDAITRAVYRMLAINYLRLSQLANRYRQTDIISEPPTAKPQNETSEAGDKS